ncbi:MAG: BrnT family toxin [Geminicoccaceae bacterium]|nr:BrnT family toxin [Geminicoccaceae bacterium]
MNVEWDDEKDERTLTERGFSFADVLPAFSDSNRMVEVDDRYEYGEVRFRLFGRVAGRLFVVFTKRADTIRIISARRANARERKRYGESPT